MLLQNKISARKLKRRIRKKEVKKFAAKNLKIGHAEKDVKSKWAAKTSCYMLIDLKYLIMMTIGRKALLLPATITLQLANNSNVCGLVIIIKNFILSKILIPSKAGGCGYPY